MWEANYRVYGARKLWKAAQRAGHDIGRDQVSRLNRPIYAAIGVDLHGHKDILGMWAGQGGGESAKFWIAVLTDLKNRGVGDVFFVVCDGLKGLPASVNTVWPEAIVQTCIIHLIRGSRRYASTS